MRIPQHNEACAICGVSAELHGSEDPPMQPTTKEPHGFEMRADWYSHEGSTAQDVIHNTGETRMQLPDKFEWTGPSETGSGIYLDEKKVQTWKCLRGEHEADELSEPENDYWVCKHCCCLYVEKA